MSRVCSSVSHKTTPPVKCPVWWWLIKDCCLKLHTEPGYLHINLLCSFPRLCWMGNSYWTAVVFIETVWLIDCVLNSCDLRLKYSSDNSDRSPVIGWGCKRAPVNCPWAATFMFRFILEELAKSKDRCPAYLMQSRAITCMDAAPCKLSLILLSICLYASAGGKAGRQGGKNCTTKNPCRLPEERMCKAFLSA